MICYRDLCTTWSRLNFFLELINFSTICPLPNNSIYPQNYAPNLRNNQEFDYIIVGAGSAGSALANRLTENGLHTVLLIEAGTYPSTFSEVPNFFPLTVHTNENWGNKVEPGNYCKGILGGVCELPRGKLLGGTSGINAMLNVESNKNDHDRWVADGAEGWDWETVQKYYKRLFKESDPINGYMKTSTYSFGLDIRNILLNNNDLMQSSSDLLRYYETKTNIYDGGRYSSAKAYISPIKMRPNLFLALDTFARRIIFDSSTSTIARGVEINFLFYRINIKARKEVIISAGALNSPQLLMLSGIGPKAHLNEMGITVRKDLPVGKNLQDHVLLTQLVTMPDHNVIIGDLVEYCEKHSGTLAEVNVNNILGFINTRNDSDYPNLQFHHYYLSEFSFDAYMTMVQYNPELTALIAEEHLQHDMVMIAPTLLNPKSRGTILLRNTDPESKVKIFPNYFADERDLDELIAGIRWIEYTIANNPGFKDSQLVDLGQFNCEEYIKDSDDYWRCVLRNFAISIHHLSGTCKMGRIGDPRSVVNTELQVIGIDKLRVVDASIMPFVVSGNTNIPTIMIAERASDLILSD